MYDILNNRNFLNQNMMGPNSIVILNELLTGQTLPQKGKILDLGCGKGLTSIALSQKTQADIFALDLWIAQTDNSQTFKNLNLDKRITAIQADIMDAPFAPDSFDAMISIDSYHYFGNKDNIMDDIISPIIKKDGIIFMAFPGLKKDIHDNLPQHLLSYWSEEDFMCFHDIPWWKNLLQKSQTTELISIKEMDCFDEAWNLWLQSGNTYAEEDRKAMELGGREIMNLISVVIRKK